MASRGSPESRLEGELDEHLGYAKHDPAGRWTPNSRNGKRSKTVVTEVGPVELDVPLTTNAEQYHANGADLGELRGQLR
jgi:transposase-like protein